MRGNIMVIGGQAAARRVHLHHLDRRPSTPPCSRVSRREVRREMGSGQQESHEGHRDTPSVGVDRRDRVGGPAVKIRSVRHNNRKKTFEVRTSSKRLVFPFSKAGPMPTIEDPIRELFVDDEAGREAFAYVLSSGRSGTVHVEQVL